MAGAGANNGSRSARIMLLQMILPSATRPDTSSVVVVWTMERGSGDWCKLGDEAAEQQGDGSKPGVKINSVEAYILVINANVPRSSQLSSFNQ